MKLITVRHGQTVANATRIAAGREIDSPLTEQGIKDAQAAGEHLRGTAIDGIIATPMQRAAHTARIIRETLALNLPIEVMPEFTEITVGEGAGWPLDKYFERKASSQPIVGAETPDQIFERVSVGLKLLEQRPGTILLVTHGDILRMIDCIDQGLKVDNFTDIPQRENGQVKVYSLPLKGRT